MNNKTELRNNFINFLRLSFVVAVARIKNATGQLSPLPDPGYEVAFLDTWQIK